MRIIDFFDRGASLDPGRTFLVSESGKETSYAQAQVDSIAIAKALCAKGIEKGDVVGVLSPNVPEAMLAILGIWRAGAVWVPLNPRNALHGTIGLMNDINCRALFIHEVFETELVMIRAETPGLDVIVSLGTSFGTAQSFDLFIEQGAHTDLRDWGDPEGNPTDTCTAFPTGGTTGRSKVVQWTNSVWLTLQETAERSWPDMTGAVYLLVAPMTHAAGVLAVLFASTGSTVVIQSGFDAENVLESIQEHRVTHLFLPPTAFYGLTDAQERSPRDVSSLKMLLVAAAPVSPDRLARGAKVFGDCVSQCWGQAEAPMMLTYLDAETITAARQGIGRERLSSCGRATHLSQVAAMDDQGMLLPAGQSGELVARGSLVAPGYLGNPEETAATRTHGWHHTGDIGRIDDDGFVYILDRKEDMIISGGFNVYASEVEAALFEFEQVQQCAVIGVPDDKWGEAVTAVVVARNGFCDKEALIGHAKRQLGSVKAPKDVVFVDTIPMTAVGKIDKNSLRETYWAGRERSVN